MHLPNIRSDYRTLLILVPILSVVLIGIPSWFFNGPVVASLTGYTDYTVYYQGVQYILSGQYPWTAGNEFYYPPLAFVPFLIAYAISLIGGGFLAFTLTIWILMLICSIITTFCVYYTGLKIYAEKTAFLAAMLNATAIAGAYYIVHRFDAFPACLAMLAVTTTLYQRETCGYAAAVLGVFTKLWPIILFPILWIYNARNSSIISEGKNRAGWFILAAGIGVLLMLAAGYTGFVDYVNLEYCNTIPYTVFQYCTLAGLPISFHTIGMVCRLLIPVGILGAVYLMYKHPGNIVLMLQLILGMIIVIIMFSQFRSPQYIVWFIPFAALLVADDLWGIFLFCGVQILSLLEYPLLYGTLYVNPVYLSNWALLFFTIYFVILGLLMWRAFLPKSPAGTGNPKKI